MIRSLISLIIFCATQPLASAASLKHDLDSYIRAYQNGNRLSLVHSSKKISAKIFQSSQSSQYIELLNEVDSRAAESPQAIYDLAKTLQLRWEAQYLSSLTRLESHSRLQGAKAGLVGSTAALGILLVFKPSLSPLYFRTFRQALLFSGLTSTVPVAVHLSSEAGALQVKRKKLSQAIPPSPAEVMNLGGMVSSSFQSEDEAEKKIAQELQDLTTRGALGTASYALTQVLAAERLAQLGLAPSKVNPLTLLLSMGVSLMVEEGVEAGLHYSREQELLKHIEQDLQSIQRAESSGNLVSYYDSAESWVKTSLQWAHWISQRTAPKTVPPNSCALYFALNSLQSSSDVSDGSNPGLISWILSGFDVWKANEETAKGYSMGEASEKGAFQQYLRRWSRSIEEQMALQIRSGDWAQTPNEFLIQAASILKQSNDPYVEDQANTLSALAIRNQWISQQGANP